MKDHSRLYRAVAVTAPALLMLIGGYLRRWAGDDGFINLRVVDHLLAGDGFVFNAGERSEAVTSAGWVLLLWLFGELGCDVASAAWVSALALSALGVAAATLAAAELRRDEARPLFLLPLGTLLYAAIPAAWDYATSALENGLGVGYIGLGFLLSARAVNRGSMRYGAALFLGLAPLVRPDYALFGIAMGAVLVAFTEGRRPRAWLIGVAALPGLAYQIFRMGYFASLVPNTALAKEAFQPRWEQGLRYLDNLLGLYALAPALGIALALLALWVVLVARSEQRRRIALPLALAAAGLLNMLYVIRVGGDFMHGRMLLPGLFALLAPVGSLACTRVRAWESIVALAGTVFIVGWAFTAAGKHMDGNVHGIGDERAWHARLADVENPTHLDDYKKFFFYADSLAFKRRIAAGCPNGMNSLLPDVHDACSRIALPDPMDGALSDLPPGTALPLKADVAPPWIVATVGFRPLGIAGNVFGRRINVTDHFGLADPLASRLELTSHGRPGHEKSFTTTWFAAKYAAPDTTHDPAVVAARKALDCGLAGELYRATREPMTLGRFFANLWLSFQLHWLRVPLDPFAAEKLLCAAH